MIIIGEKLNGSVQAVKEAIARRDEEFIRQNARLQAEHGAAYLDCCASVPEEEELTVLQWMLAQIQAVTETPVCIDSPNPSICVEAMKYCKRPGLVNSVSMEKGKIETIFPAVAGTEWGVVALLCGKNGLPRNVEERLQILDEIMEQAAAYGVAQEQIYVDPLVLPFIQEPSTASVFASCCRQIRKKYENVHITSGLSNVSYGMHVRTAMNRVFLILAMEAGMDCAIMNPLDQEMQQMVYTTEVLLGKKEYEAELLGDDDNSADKLSKIQEIALTVEKGKAKVIGKYVKEALEEGYAPNDILNRGMIDAMCVVGEKYKNAAISEPEMLVAARAMKAGIEALKPYLVRGRGSYAGTMILGTVAGDLHDIGKNLVAMMVEAAGIRVIDLGIDVPAERFLKAVEENPDAGIVACSALLTTTMSSLRNIVAALNASPQRERFKIMVGGAPVTKEFAEEIGADAYTADAAAAARKAKELIQSFGDK